MTHVAKADVTIKFSVMVPFKDDGIVVLEDQAETEVMDAFTAWYGYHDYPPVEGIEVNNIDITKMGDDRDGTVTTNQ